MSIEHTDEVSFEALNGILAEADALDLEELSPQADQNDWLSQVHPNPEQFDHIYDPVIRDEIARICAQFPVMAGIAPKRKSPIHVYGGINER